AAEARCNRARLPLTHEARRHRNFAFPRGTLLTCSTCYFLFWLDRRPEPAIRIHLVSYRRSLDLRQLLPLVVRRRRRKLPLEGRCTLTPRIGASLALLREGLEHAVEEDQDADTCDVRT